MFESSKNQSLKTRILLVDDHSLTRAGMRALLEETEQVTVVGEASNGREAMVAIAKHKPDIVLMDIVMPEMDGIEATAQATTTHPTVKIIILSMHATESYITEALQAGAAGYVVKNNHISELHCAITTVMQGQMYLTPSISQHVAAIICRLSKNRSDIEKPDVKLTSRQIEILILIAKGIKTRIIAERLHISVKTVETHRANIMKRLDIFDIAGLTRYALHTNLIK